MSTITPLNESDNWAVSRWVINQNFENLNTDKLEAADIADFETSTQLDARDATNRDRSNHTGTQTASTISDLDTVTIEFTNKTLNDSSNEIHADVLHYEIQATAAITRWQPLVATGVTDDTVIKAEPRSSLTQPVIWIAEMDIANWLTWEAVSVWVLPNIPNAWSWVVWDVLYADATGWFTTTPAISTTNYNQPIAYVLKANPSLVTLIVNVHSWHEFASLIAYDNTTSWLTATNTQAAIDEVEGRVDAIESDYLDSADIWVTVQWYDANNATASSTTTFTNKSGNISQWTNDSGYLTWITAEPIWDLSDVTIATPTDWQVLTYNSTSWEWENADAWGGWSASFNGWNGLNFSFAWEVVSWVIARFSPYSAWTFNEFRVSADTTTTWTATFTVKQNGTSIWTVTLTSATSATNWLYINTSTDLADSFSADDNCTIEYSDNGTWLTNLVINLK